MSQTCQNLTDPPTATIYINGKHKLLVSVYSITRLTPYKTHLCWFIYHVYNRLFSMNVRFINHIDEGIYLIFAVRPTQQKGHVHVIFNEKESLFLQHSSDTRQLKVPHKIKLHLKDKKTI